jgi:Zn-dependent protease/CBS domain-containing protein
MFTKRILIGNLLGIPVYIDLSWFVVALLITWSLATSLFPSQYKGLDTSVYWFMGSAGAIGLFLSILAHELGHSVVAQQFSVPIRGITLFLFGGVAELTREPPSAWAEFWVAIAGPAVSAVLALSFLGLSAVATLFLPVPVTGVLYYLGWVNGLVVVFNLIPAFPLDGGRVLRSLIWSWRGDLRRATRITATLGTAFGTFLILMGVLTLLQGGLIPGIWSVMIGIFLRNGAQMSYQQAMIRRALEGEAISRFMTTAVIGVPPSLTIQQFVDDYLLRFHHKLYPVLVDTQLLGAITSRDVQRVPRTDWQTHTVGQLLQPFTAENTISPEADAMAALARMNREQQSRLLVVRDGQLVGMLTLKDLIDFMALKVELDDPFA